MNVNLFNAKGVSEKLRKLLDEHDEVHVAVAWGSNGPIASRLLKNKHKFRSVTFGLAFCQTDAELVDRLVGVKNAYVADGGSGTFHPKIYYFRTGDVAEAIIGSSNFTMGGLDRNWEASVHVKGLWSATVFRQIRECLDGYAGLRKPVTEELATNYRLQYEAAKLLRKPRNPVFPGSDLAAVQLNSPSIRMSWGEYVNAVTSSSYHDYDRRLSLLRECQTMLTRVNSFATLSGPEWKAIAGVIGDKERHDAGLDDHDWKWFRAMGGMGVFANRVAEKDAFLAQAVDCIPRHGEATRDQYEDF